MSRIQLQILIRGRVASSRKALNRVLTDLRKISPLHGIPMCLMDKGVEIKGNSVKTESTTEISQDMTATKKTIDTQEKAGRTRRLCFLIKEIGQQKMAPEVLHRFRA
jgi:hypothetical protein